LCRHCVPIARDEADTTFRREPSGSLKYPEYGVLRILTSRCLLHDATCAAATSDVATYSVIVPGFLCSCKVVRGREVPPSGRVSDTRQ